MALAGVAKSATKANPDNNTIVFIYFPPYAARAVSLSALTNSQRPSKVAGVNFTRKSISEVNELGLNAAAQGLPQRLFGDEKNGPPVIIAPAFECLAEIEIGLEKR